jgi:hypothetical protein
MQRLRRESCKRVSPVLCGSGWNVAALGRFGTDQQIILIALLNYHEVSVGVCLVWLAPDGEGDGTWQLTIPFYAPMTPIPRS